MATNSIQSFIEGVQVFFIPIIAGVLMAFFSDEIIPAVSSTFPWFIPPSLRSDVIRFSSNMGELLVIVGLLIVVLWAGVAFISYTVAHGAE